MPAVAEPQTQPSASPETVREIGPLETYAPYLRLLARMNLGNGLGGKLDASDIAQQALLVAHRERDQFKGRTEAEWLGWLRAILASTVSGNLRHFSTQGRDLARERSLEGVLDQSNARLDAMAGLAADQSSPSERASKKEESVLLATALAELSADEQVAIELHHLQGMAVAEVAQRMGRSRAAVAGLLFRGLKRLRGMLRPGAGEMPGSGDGDQA